MPTIESEQADLVLSLRVILFPDGDQWGAQGLELDYMTAGESPEKAKANFSRGACGYREGKLEGFRFA